ncbi:MAG: multidrug ABC transporter ATP-binding protein [Anaerolineaceae bacterium 4572_32.1]|nr:MAG: multidrug ABC transporter ATP-binding protein [Anaerolineaceae bacterium 4572_32.1]
MKSITHLWRFVKPYGRLVVLGLLLLAVVVAVDLALPRLMQELINTGIRQRDMGTILNISLIMVGFTLVSTTGTVGSMIFAARVSQMAATDLRRELFVHIQSFSFANLDRLQTGQLVTRLTSDISQVAQLIWTTMRSFVRAPLMIAGSLILVFLTNWQLGLLMLVLMPITIVIFMFYASKAQPLFMQVQRKLDRLNTILQENLAGVRVVKAFARAGHENRRFDTANVDLMGRTIRVERMLAVLSPTLRLLVNLGLVAVVWFGGAQVVKGDLSVGEIVALSNYVWWVVWPLAMLSLSVGFVSSADASTQRIFEVLDSQPEVADEARAEPLPAVKGRVALEDVVFTYSKHDENPVLEGINLVVEPGETVALVGATGAGKSTLINLVPRFYDVSKGRVTLDGVDVRDITLDSLRAQVGAVLQETVLFTGTVSDNIRYGRPDASDEEVVAAAQAAQAHDFIVSFPAGYDTPIGQRGVNLSGGQKQRIAIARALLARPRVLIMDDSTSSVDVETESKILSALDRFMANHTRLVVAQRLSTIMNADKIVVLDRGRIAASGTHGELLTSSPIYREIYQSQLGNHEGETSHEG